MPQRIILLVTVIAALSATLIWLTAIPNQVSHGDLDVVWQEDQNWSLPNLHLQWDAADEQLTVHDTQSIAWASSPGQSWLGAGQIDDNAAISLRNARNPLRQMTFCSGPRWGDMISVRDDGPDYLQLSGALDCAGELLGVNLSFKPGEGGGVQLTWAVDGPVDFSYLMFERGEEEVFSGFGLQPEGMRATSGRLSLQRRADDNLSAGRDGATDRATRQTSPGAWPAAASSEHRAMLAQAEGSLVLDLQSVGTARLESWWSNGGQLDMQADALPKTLATWLHNLQGGPEAIPAWVHAAPVVGTARRNEALTSLFENLLVQGTPVSRVLLEDSGQPIGWMNWPLQRREVDDVPLPSALPQPGQPWPALITTQDFTTGWGPQSGLKGSLHTLLAGGMSGLSTVHTPVGGTLEAQRLWWRSGRTAELFLRWLELNTFTAWLRLHEGVTPEVHYQMNDTASGRVHFDRMARLYVALADYRSTLWDEATERGWPVVRPLWFEYPADQVAWQVTDQFMMGSHLLVAPILESGVIRRDVYLPEGGWTHLWTERQWSSTGQTINLASPIGEPIVLVRADMPERERLLVQARRLSIGNLLSQ